MTTPTTYEEVKTVWTDKVYDALMTNFDATGWADLTMPTDGVECLTEMFKIKIVPVDMADLVTLCGSVSDCDFVADDFYSYALAFAMNRGDMLAYDGGGACSGWSHPFFFTKDDSVLPFNAIKWGGD